MQGQTSVENIILCQEDWAEKIFKRNIQDAQTALKLATPTLVSLANYTQLGQQSAFAVLVKLIKEVADNLNVGKSFNDLQLDFCARMVYNEYYFFKISEIRYAFLQGILGRYGQTFDRLDVSVLISWLAAYDKERMSILNDQKVSESNTTQTGGTFLKNAPEEIRLQFNFLMSKLKFETAGKDKAAKLIYEYCTLKNLNFDTVLNKYLKQYKSENLDTSFDIWLDKTIGTELMKLRLIEE